MAINCVIQSFKITKKSSNGRVVETLDN